MQRRRWLSFGLAAAAILFAGGSAWAALTSSSYRMANNTFEGGSAGAGVSSSSASYALTGVTFGATTSLLTSSSYQLCTGFACADPVNAIYLTTLHK